VLVAIEFLAAVSTLACRSGSRNQAQESAFASRWYSAPTQEPHPRQGGGKGARARPGTGTCRFRQTRAASTRRRAGVRAGPKSKNAAPAGAPLQAARDRARHKSRSA